MIRSRRTLLAASLLTLAGCRSPSSVSTTGTASVPTVGILVYGPDPSTDECVRGLKEGLKEAGYEEGRTLRIEYGDAQGDVPTIQTIAQKFVSGGLDVIVPMTTPCLVATASAVRGTDRKVVFTSVYDPFAAGVAKSPSDHPANLTGVASPPPVGPLLELVKELTPNVRRFGTIYNAGEANSVSAVSRLREAARQHGLKMIEQTVAVSTEVQQAARSLIGRIDAFVIPGDNTVNVSLEAVVGVAKRERIPIYFSDPASVERGALAAVGPEFYAAGQAAAEMVAAVLKGTSIEGMDIQVLETPEIAVNRKVAEELKITLPPGVLQRAKKVAG